MFGKSVCFSWKCQMFWKTKMYWPEMKMFWFRYTVMLPDRNCSSVSSCFHFLWSGYPLRLIYNATVSLFLKKSPHCMRGDTVWLASIKENKWENQQPQQQLAERIRPHFRKKCFWNKIFVFIFFSFAENIDILSLVFSKEKRPSSYQF